MHPHPLTATFAPTGSLRAAINYGNRILAQRDAAGQPEGVSVDLARELAQRLGVPLACVPFDTARDAVQAVREERADIGFFAVDPMRGEGIGFTQPYVLIEGAYLVREESPLGSADEVDREGMRVVVGAGSAYDLHLSRALRHARILRAASSSAVVALFLEEGAEVAAGVRQQLEADAARQGGLRLLEPAFMTIRQAMGAGSARGAEALAFLSGFVDAMIVSGFVADALARHGIEGAEVAPASKA
ncbi:transporter substrate-binding domain-containing protein [Ramlibacter sp. AN1015]|uniref:transporter substrate-binding domain-containing protein n=1 Tax=Ramlibacter sp. AN1015 TaxID=3133428 RepID=UPI0030BBB30B